ncbi:hypothetical protein BS47DRAFT_1394418 [Hydnum rufescens UP504]|uniref:Uncharacterized protein n=1 Tax=Hydnum rufescens UP504 TaxID=1448309 RepID=A0A9P6AV39_9AGAM|nr:hypothetical protein BS47DRAFT_1394418 [Hydnum rufescens UP504]
MSAHWLLGRVPTLDNTGWDPPRRLRAGNQWRYSILDSYLLILTPSDDWNTYSPVETIQASLKAVDSTLASIGVAAEAVHTPLSPLPPTTSDYNEASPSSLVSKGIDAVRVQVQRGLFVTATSPEIINTSLDGIAVQLRLTEGLDDRKDTGFLFRSADGSGNSLSSLGNVFTPYSSCSTTRSISDDKLSDLGLIFGALLRRATMMQVIHQFSPHPDGLSACSSTSRIFRTTRTDWNINQPCSYVGLGILYGSTQAHQHRLLSLPPGVATLIVYFDRYHNYVADILLSINQRGSWTADLETGAARLINSAFDANVTLSDYLVAILGTQRERRQADDILLERGRGDSCSVEFNTIYQMTLLTIHISENAFQRIFNHGQPFDFNTPVDCLQSSIPNLRRDPHTKLYSDDDLARILQRAAKVPAGTFRARGVPGVLRVIKILGLAAEEAKSVIPGSGLCPPCQYTSHFASRSGIRISIVPLRRDGPSHSCRCDCTGPRRSLSYDFTPFNLTTWAFVDANRNTENTAWGGQLGRVLARTLSDHYDAESVCTHFLLVTPTGHPWSIDNILDKNGYAGQYSLDSPAIRPITKLVVYPNAMHAALRDYVEQKLLVTKSVQDLFVPKTELEVIGKHFYEKTLQLLREKSMSSDLSSFIGHRLRSPAGLPLKTATEPHRIYYEQQMYHILKDIYSFIFLEADTSLKIPQRWEARDHVERLSPLSKSLANSLIGPISNLILGYSSRYLDALLKRLLVLHPPIGEVAEDILGVIFASSIELSQSMLYTFVPGNIRELTVEGHKRATYLYGRVVTVTHSNTHDSTVILGGYVREALRLDPVVKGVYRQTRTEGVNKVEPNRPADLYSILHSDGVFKTFGEGFVSRITGRSFEPFSPDQTSDELQALLEPYDEPKAGGEVTRHSGAIPKIPTTLTGSLRGLQASVLSSVIRTLYPGLPIKL